MYQHRPSRLPGAVVWTLTAEDDEVRVLPDGCMEQLALHVGVRPSPELRLIEDVAQRARGGQRVADIADAVGLSRRQLQRRCVDAFGYGAKTLASILRMGGALELARSGTTFADTAARSGYADQAHLAREVKLLAGVPLGQLVSPAGSAANRSTPLPSGSLTTA